MKKLLAVMMLLCCAVAAFADTIVPKIGVDLAGNKNLKVMSVSANFDTDAGFTIAGEYLHPVNKDLQIGGGLQYLFERKIDFPYASNATFSFLPIYATVLYNPFREMKGIEPYGKFDLGYNVFYGGNKDYTTGVKLSGGIYWGAGVGARLTDSNVVVELMYGSYAGSVDPGIPGLKFDTTYTKFSLIVGYAFDTK